MPKLTKQAFFPCNPHGAVRSATVYAAAATPGAAQSGSGSSRLLGGMRDTSASLTKIGLPPVSGFARKRHPPAECNHSLGLGVCSSSHGSPSWCQALPSSAPQQSPGQVPQISSWHLLGGGMGRGSLPLPSLQKSILMKEMTAGSAGWPGLPEGTAQCQGLAVLRVR